VVDHYQQHGHSSETLSHTGSHCHRDPCSPAVRARTRRIARRPAPRLRPPVRLSRPGAGDGFRRSRGFVGSARARGCRRLLCGLCPCCEDCRMALGRALRPRRIHLVRLDPGEARYGPVPFSSPRFGSNRRGPDLGRPSRPGIGSTLSALVGYPFPDGGSRCHSAGHHGFCASSWGPVERPSVAVPCLRFGNGCLFPLAGRSGGCPSPAGRHRHRLIFLSLFPPLCRPDNPPPHPSLDVRGRRGHCFCRGLALPSRTPGHVTKGLPFFCHMPVMTE